MNIIQFLNSLIAVMVLTPLLVSGSTLTVKGIFENEIANNCATDCVAGISGNILDVESILAAASCFTSCLDRNGLADNQILTVKREALTSSEGVTTQLVACEAAATAAFGVCMGFAWTNSAKAQCTAHYAAAMVPCLCCLP